MSNQLYIKSLFKTFVLVSFVFSSLIHADDDCNYLCLKAKSVQEHVTFYAGLSGGYGRLQDAYASTGQSGIYRISLGSFINLSKSMKFGSELGFQNGTQMLLTETSTSILGENSLPVTLFVSTPADLLLTLRVEPYKMFFFNFKGGFVHENVAINGAHVRTSYVWQPDMQFGTGVTLFSKSRISINYQKFFGRYPKLINLNVDTGETSLKGSPNLQAILLTVEINI